MKVWIDQDLCTGDGLCEEIAPDVFTLLDDGLAYVKDGDKIFSEPGGAEARPSRPARRKPPSSPPRNAPASASSSRSEHPGAVSPSVAIVLPVRDGAELLEWSLPPLVRQAAELAATVVVVDDDSRDSTAMRAAALGAEVISGPGHGPYVARNRGWKACDADIVVFTDVRCRPDDGWLRRIVAAFDDPSVGLAGGRSEIEPGADLCRRLSVRLDPYGLEYHLEFHALPYLPTANLAVRAGVLRELDGFEEVRSGGDAALCWDAQKAGHGLRAIDDAVVVVRPRGRLRDVMRQYRRYGRSGWRLAQERTEARPPERLARTLAGCVTRCARSLRHPRRDDLAVDAAVLLVQVSHAVGVLGARVRDRRVVRPDDRARRLSEGTARCRPGSPGRL